MIELTKLNGDPIFINCDLIERVETGVDTRLLLINGHMYVIRETGLELQNKVIEFRSKILSTANLSGGFFSLDKSFLIKTEESIQNG